MDQPKLERMLRLMKLLSSNINYNIEELSDKLDMSERTIYRYLDSFKNAGFTVTKLWANTYKLEKMPEGVPEFDKLMFFSEEESTLVNSLLDAIVPTNAMKKGLKDKLAVILDSTAVAKYIDPHSNNAHIKNLMQAARDKHSVLLKNYESGHSHTIRDRIIEPFAFTTNFTDVCAFDIEDGKNKNFKIQRIGEVQILNELWKSESKHKKQQMDLFRFSGESIGTITWEMSVMAKNLLIEEYPLSRKYLKRKGNTWILNTELCSYIGACRFYVGLAGEIKIIGDEGFKNYIKNYLTKITQS